MIEATLGAVPPTGWRRLVEHYGPAAECWLRAVPALFDEAAARWRLRLAGYHDAGYASVIAVARDPDERMVLLKAWYDRSRYAYEIAALRAWPSPLVARVIDAADDLTVAALELVGGRPAGGARPSEEYERTALGIAALHGTHVETVPQLSEHLATVVLPRIERRRRMFGQDLPERHLDAVARLEPQTDRAALLHADLYRANVLFDLDGQPVFVDPLPMVGDRAYDWAFWVVYYDLLRDPVPRLRLASAIGEVPLPHLLPWCLTLSVDGLLYYRETGDSRAPRMADVLTVLAAHDHRATLC